MTMEHFTSTQTSEERDALFPSVQAAEAMLADDTIGTFHESPTPKTELLPILASKEVDDEGSPESASYVRTTDELDDWLHFRVKKELFEQFYLGHGEDEMSPDAVNISGVVTAIKDELTTQKDRHYRSAQELENTLIPQANMRETPDFNSIRGYSYSQRDLDNLETRAEVHMKMHDRIVELLDTDEDFFRSVVAEKYIEATRDEARNEVVQELKKQKHTLETHLAEDAAHIKRLETALDALSASHTEAIRQLSERDMQLLDTQLEQHLDETDVASHDLAR